MFKRFASIALLSILAFSACSTIQDIYTDVPKQVAEAQATLAAAEHSALVYASFPVCGATSSVLCRNPSITAKIKVADDAAYTAVNAAYQAESQTELEAAQTALSALTTITDNLPAPTTTPSQ